MTSLKWEIGAVEIFQIVELEAGRIIQSIIPNAIPENIKKIRWLYPHFADKNGILKAQVQSFLIKSENKNILVDTSNGNNKPRIDIPEWANLKTNFLEQLFSLGVTDKDVDIVACTHLHFDHVGWNTKLVNGRWIPTFPSAKYLFVKDEYEYWVKKPEKEINDDKVGFDDSVAPIMRAGLSELVENNHRIDKNVSFIPTHGHTPAHTSILIESKGKSAIISGDFIYHPCQIAHPEWSTESDNNPDKATETRKKLLNEIFETNTILIGSHFPNPVAGRVARSDEGYVFIVQS